MNARKRILDEFNGFDLARLRGLVAVIFLGFLASTAACTFTQGGAYHRILPERLGDTDAVNQALSMKAEEKSHGRSCTKTFWIGPLVIPFAFDSSLKSAMEDALKGSNASALANVYEYETTFFFPFVIGYVETCAHVEGTPVSTQTLKVAPEPPPELQEMRKKIEQQEEERMKKAIQEINGTSGPEEKSEKGR